MPTGSDFPRIPRPLRTTTALAGIASATFAARTINHRRFASVSASSRIALLCSIFSAGLTAADTATKTDDSKDLAQKLEAFEVTGSRVKRLDYLPKREVVSTTMSSVAGLRGTALRIWNWETAVSYGRNETMRDTDLIAAADLQAALNGTTRATACNPFGPSDNPDIEKNLYTRSHGLDGKIDSFSYDASVNGSFYQLPIKGAGELGLAAGYEYRRDELTSNPEPNNFIGFTATTPFKGNRNINSAYAELAVPLQKWLEFQFAGRHERYSDFGNTTKPKVGAKLRLPGNRFVNVVLRGATRSAIHASAHLRSTPMRPKCSRKAAMPARVPGSSTTRVWPSTSSGATTMASVGPTRNSVRGSRPTSSENTTTTTGRRSVGAKTSSR